MIQAKEVVGTLGEAANALIFCVVNARVCCVCVCVVCVCVFVCVCVYLALWHQGAWLNCAFLKSVPFVFAPCSGHMTSVECDIGACPWRLFLTIKMLEFLHRAMRAGLLLACWSAFGS